METIYNIGTIKALEMTLVTSRSCVFVHSFIHLFIHLFIYLFIYLFVFRLSNQEMLGIHQKTQLIFHAAILK